MFAHLPGNMRQYIALAGNIDTKHRPRQHLRHCSFRNDRSFLWHRAKYIRECAALNRWKIFRVSADPPPLRAMTQCAEDSALYSPGSLTALSSQLAMGIPNELSILTRLFERKRRQIFAQLLPFPPRAGLTMFLSGREAVAIKHGANVTGGRIRKRILRKKSFDIAFASQQRNHRAHKPRVIPRCPERGEPHLPIETRL